MSSGPHPMQTRAPMIGGDAASATAARHYRVFISYSHEDQDWLQRLRDRRILVRWFSHPSVRSYLRITIGTPEEATALARAAKAIVRLARG